MKITSINLIALADWNKLVESTYGRPYSFQQQDGCRPRGIYSFTVPDKAEDFERVTVPEVVNDPVMGVKFDAWLKRDPKQPLPDRPEDWATRLWWARNFYPDIQMVANDLHARGLLEAGDYTINIDW